MPADLAKQIAALGFSESNIPQTYKLYASQPRVYEPSEIKVMKGVAYGTHERQRLDIHTATMRRSERPVPIIAVFHGGGLVAGMRENTTTFAEYFASIGFVGVAAGYRLAPDFKWPEGGRDVGAVVTWLRDHAREYGGDPDRIFITGISSGSLHAATYVFRPELMPPGTARAAGAILLSGPYTFDFSAPNTGELAYFGENKSRWPQMVVPGNVTRTDIPVLFTTSEYDDPRYLKAHAALFSESWRSTASGHVSDKPRAQSRVPAAVGRHGGHQRLARDPGFHRSGDGALRMRKRRLGAVSAVVPVGQEDGLSCTSGVRPFVRLSLRRRRLEIGSAEEELNGRREKVRASILSVHGASR